MKVIRGYDGLAPEAQGATAAIGNFDGVHRGHQALLAAAREAAPGAPLGVVTFEPHPRRFFQPDIPPFRLTTAAERARILRGLGVDVLYELSFDGSLAGMEAEDFAANVLGHGLGLSHLVVGADFRFGRGRRGDTGMLQRIGPDLGFGVSVQPLLGDEDGTFASTALRALVAEGRVAEAAAALGRWHTVTGRVSRGDQRGRELGYPTANLEFGEQICPRFGVYAARVTVHDGMHAGLWDGVASIGVRPTFGVNAPNFEVHLFDFAGDLYGADISVALVTFLRGELRFDGVEALIRQMDADSADARAALAAARLPEPV